MDTPELAHIKTHDLPQKWANAILDLTGKVVSFCALGDDFQPRTTLDHFKHLTVDGKAPNAEVKTSALAELNSYLLQRHRQSLLDIREQRDLDPNQDLSELYRSFRETCWEIVLANHEFIYKAASFNALIMSDIGLNTNADEIFQEIMVLIYEQLQITDTIDYSGEINLVVQLSRINPAYLGSLVKRADSTALLKTERNYLSKYQIPMYRIRRRHPIFVDNSNTDTLLLASMLIYKRSNGELTFRVEDIPLAVSDIQNSGTTAHITRGERHTDKTDPIEYFSMLERYKYGYNVLRAILFPRYINSLSMESDPVTIDMEDIIDRIYAKQLIEGFILAYMQSTILDKRTKRERNIKLFRDRHGLDGKKPMSLNDISAKYGISLESAGKLLQRLNNYCLSYIHRQNRRSKKA